MATIWKGAIAFGLVNVPVEFRPAVRENRLHFRMLSREGNVPIKFQRIREDTGEEVPWSGIVKGYHLPNGEYVVLTNEDFKDAAVEEDKRIAILDFVDPTEIDPRFFESSYFLVPSRGGEDAYALLRAAMEETGTIGIGKVVMHQRQHLVAMRVLGDALEIVLMRFADELIDAAEYTFPPRTRSRPEEVKLAVTLINHLRSPFVPDKYADEYNENLRRIIEARAKGEAVTLTGGKQKVREPKVLDLMERLQASLQQGREGATRRVRTNQRARPTRAKRGARRKHSA